MAKDEWGISKEVNLGQIIRFVSFVGAIMYFIVQLDGQIKLNKSSLDNMVGLVNQHVLTYERYVATHHSDSQHNFDRIDDKIGKIVKHEYDSNLVRRRNEM
jgi:hypothetical protein